jgi:hypothetical protein
MRELYSAIPVFILLTCLCSACHKTAEEDLVFIPSKEFLEKLVNSGADKNGDGLISFPEAEAVEVIVIPPSGISDLTGLEAFIKLDSLTITLNPLVGIDLSSNRLLRYLDITYCELNHLDLTNNVRLETLICGRNRLTAIDLSNNQALNTLIVNNNLLTSLDLSPISSLNTLIICGNQLSYLDISKHSLLTKIGVDNMPMLTEVCVWTLPFPSGGIVVLQDYSPNIRYATNCNN